MAGLTPPPVLLVKLHALFVEEAAAATTRHATTSLCVSILVL